ncbi:MAG: hypothetical protein IJE15_02760, partial [Bacteroidaceae bacterium]|nr:hypothetical protein [Bacteroidaceae bacterium]
LQPANNGTLQFVVSNFPTFGESTQTRAIGTQDEGKTAWADGDNILVHLYSQKYGDQAVTLTFDAENNTWESDGGTLSYLENETPTITAVYAPDCEIKSDKSIGLLEGKQYGEAEYIPAKTTISGNTLDIRFESGRTYSRLRIATMSNASLTVSTEGFTPAGATEVATAAYTLNTDNNGNAFLYGVFAEDATVSVKQGEVTLKDYTFTAEKNPNGTEHNKSYALDARPVIDGTLGGKTEATEEDITALVEQLKEYVGNGITTIIVPGSKSAIIEVDGIVLPAVSEAIYRLSKDESYNGKIDLILPDVTEIFDQEFHSARALNSITLPKVTKLADQAFYGTLYLRTITFGSVITEVNELGAIFNQIGYNVGGCDLILNCGQMNESNVPAPDLTNNIWKFKFENEFKSITLTHTGENSECDECKALQ